MLRWGEFPGDPVIRTHAFTTKDTGLIPGQRRKIPPALPHSQKKKKKLKKDCSKKEDYSGKLVS